MQVWYVLHAPCCKYRTQKSRQKSPSGHHRTTFLGYIFATKACIDNRKRNLLSSNISSTCPHNMVNFGPLAAEILSLVWGTPANFNGFRIVIALLHCTLVMGISQALRRWTEGATYIRQGGHHVGQWPTFLVLFWITRVVTVMLCSDWLTGGSIGDKIMRFTIVWLLLLMYDCHKMHICLVQYVWGHVCLSVGNTYVLHWIVHKAVSAAGRLETLVFIHQRSWWKSSWGMPSTDGDRKVAIFD